MNEKVKYISIKILLTIPALCVGILSAIIYILKPVIQLWFPEETPPIQEIIVEDLPSNHEFH